MENKARYLLEARHIVKVFGELRANDDVSLRIAPGEIHALLGENGAGKSTLVKIIYGALQPTSGELFWDGKPVTIANPAAARRLGIGMVFQHFSLFEALSVGLKGHPRVRVELRDEHINDPAFAAAAARNLLGLLGRNPTP